MQLLFQFNHYSYFCFNWKNYFYYREIMIISREILDHVTLHVLQGSWYQNAFHRNVSWLFRSSRAFLVLLSTFCQNFSTRRTFHREKESRENEKLYHYLQIENTINQWQSTFQPLEYDYVTSTSIVKLTKSEYKLNFYILKIY